MCVLKSLGHHNSIRRARPDAKITESTHPQVIDMLVDNAFLFAFLIHNVFCDDLNGTIRAANLANTTAGTFMLVVFVVCHYNFTPKAFEHHKCIAVFEILLGNVVPGSEKVLRGNFHPGKQTPDGAKYFFYIGYE